MIVECGMLQPLGEHHADLRVALIVGLQPGEHEVEALVRHRRGKCGRGERSVSAAERLILDVNRPVRSARERFTDDLLHARRTGGADDDFAVVLLAKTQRLFQRVGVGLVQLVAGILLADPRPRVVQARLPLAGWDLLDADGNLHGNQSIID